MVRLLTYFEKADFGDRKELLDWCEYVLRGLNIEISKNEKTS